MLNKKSMILISICFLLASQSLNVYAQNNRGFTPPSSGFGNNPFGGKAGADFFDDEDEDDDTMDEISDEILRQRMEQRLRERNADSGRPSTNEKVSGTSSSSVDMGAASSSVGATSLQGGANTKITPGSKNACLRLDPETGYGPDVVSNFDFPDADIIEIAKTLGRLTCINFLFDKDVRGKISIVSNAPITIGDAWRAFLSALDTNRLTLIPSGKYYRIARQADAKDKQIKTYTGASAPDNDMYITRVIPLKYINSEESSRVFRNLMPPNTRIISYDQTNTLIITDTGANIKKITDMLNVLDVETYDEKLEVIRVKYASAQDIAKLIDQLLPGSGGSAGSGGAPGGAVPRFRGGFSARRTKEGGVISHIMPDDRTNSVIISANNMGQKQVRELIEKLDTKISVSAGGSKIHVIYLQFADAEQVSTTLNALTSGAGAPKQPTTNIGGASSSSTASLFEGAVKISADKSTNSLVITGSPSDYQTIARVITKLDVPRDQVYVEAIIMEMTVDKTFELGTSIASPTNGIGFLPTQDFGNFLVNPLSVNGLVMGFQGGQGSKTFTVPGSSQSITVKSIQGLIKALQTNSNANVLSTPQLLTLDNQEASIEVAENIPVPVVTSISGGGSQASTSREKIALSLTIKPQINKISSFVKLDINQKVEDISNRVPPKAVADLALGTLSRTSKTTVVVQDGDTVALGGLVRDKVTEVATKIPLLGDIPILGWLFRSKTTSSAKQNLISFITPRVIKQYQQIRKVLDKKIKERDDFIEKNMGGEDEFKEQKMQMIKDLPGLADLKDSGAVESGDIEKEETPAGIIPPAAPVSNADGSAPQPNAVPGTPSLPNATPDSSGNMNRGAPAFPASPEMNPQG